MDLPGHAVAPPAPPPALFRAAPPESSSPRAAGLAAGAAYSIGEPTDEEQLYVEFINRSRAQPQAEAALFVATTDPEVLNAYRFFSVDLDLMTAQYAPLASLPPVSINAMLTEAARVHSLDMFQNGFQGHTGTDGSDFGQRLNRAGYTYQTGAENVYASARGVWHGHAGFEVDWGNGLGGMQTPPGHRNTIHNAAYREIGVGVVLGQTTKVGPQLVAQEFASAFNPRPLITGVVYFDFNGNQFYDVGEGIGGVTVRVSGTSTHAVTARSGGYSVPVDGNGSFTVTFQVPGLSDVTQPVTVAALANFKLNHIPPYSAPVLGGSSVAGVGVANPYVFSPVPAATAYDWRSLRRIPWIDPDGAEPGPGMFVTNTSAGYNPVATDVRRSGSASYHFAHPSPAQSQYLTLRQPLQIGADSELSYWSRLGFATANQTARVQISVDDGQTWNDLWTQAGTGASG
ncbi:MAG: CAP domain-containing protein, partial [Planctomycetota bacterium]|nr:CAP domain-containing protein [Planctomycetota bacterium]